MPRRIVAEALEFHCHNIFFTRRKYVAFSGAGEVRECVLQ